MRGQDSVTPIPQMRVSQKVDECMSRRDYAGAERVLLYWLEEAKAGSDLRGQLMVLGELVGHYRKTGEKAKALPCAREALRLVDVLGYEGTLSAATAFVNIATALESFGESREALALFERALPIYESSAGTEPGLLGGACNNMALTCVSLRQYERAMRLYERALDTMSRVENGELESAVTCLNLADALTASLGPEAADEGVRSYLDRAWDLLNREGLPRNGYYAYICEHCAPSFSYYGYFAQAGELTQRAEAIYERA